MAAARGVASWVAQGLVRAEVNVALAQVVATLEGQEVVVATKLVAQTRDPAEV